MTTKNTIKNRFKQFHEDVLTRINGRTTPEKGDLTYWRSRILFALIATGMALGFITFIPIVFLVLNSGLWQIAAYDLATWLMGFFLLFSRSLSYELRAGISLVLIYLLGLSIFLTIGPLSGGPFLMFAFAVLSGTLLGARPALAALFINSATIARLRSSRRSLLTL